MKYLKLVVYLWLSELSRAWRKSDLDPPSGDRETLPSPSTIRREAHHTLRSHTRAYESTNVKQAPRSPYGAN